jgi:hypothetical protein
MLPTSTALEVTFIAVVAMSIAALATFIAAI